MLDDGSQYSPNNFKFGDNFDISLGETQEINQNPFDVPPSISEIDLDQSVILEPSKSIIKYSFEEITYVKK